MVKSAGARKAPSTSPLGEGEQCARIVEVLKSVGHPVRLQIIALLCEGEQNVGAIADAIGASQTTVSQQLRILRMNRLVDFTRTRGFAVYRLAEPHLRELIRCMLRCCAAAG